MGQVQLQARSIAQGMVPDQHRKGRYVSRYCAVQWEGMEAMGSPDRSLGGDRR